MLNYGWRLGLLASAAVVVVATTPPARAFSALGAWRINADGVLELRTTPFANLTASFDAGGANRGPRLWIDLPGSPARPRPSMAVIATMAKKAAAKKQTTATN